MAKAKKSVLEYRRGKRGRWVRLEERVVGDPRWFVLRDVTIGPNDFYRIREVAE